MEPSVAIAQATRMRPIAEIAAAAGLAVDEWTAWGDYKAKLQLSVLNRIKDRPVGKLVLVTTINPTRFGEGKTTTTIGLGQALCRRGVRAIVGIREPSIGPTMGMKGGGTGGGLAQVLPMEDINLHFTGDFHAIGAAHNLLSALVNNHIHHGNALRIDPRRILWPRVLDVPDRALRKVVVGLGGKDGGIAHEDRFDITAASELMAILCLARDFDDLKARIARIIVARSQDGEPVTAADLQAVGALALLLKDALRPNLVQTIEGTPAFVHGGPFANIAHGTSSLLSAEIGLRLAEYYVTEAGFGSDLGAEKFFDIVCRVGGLTPSVAVLLVTLRALHVHGGVKADAARADPAALIAGLANLEKHLENLRLFGVPAVVALNRMQGDSEEEIALLRSWCTMTAGVAFAVSDVFTRGGEGGLELADAVLEAARTTAHFVPIYPLEATPRQKLDVIATKIYGARAVVTTPEADADLAWIAAHRLESLPLCVAKTQYSLSDDPRLVGRPTGFAITVREVRVSAGAGFLVPVTGTISLMPGLPKNPAATRIDIDSAGKVTGLS